MKMSVWSLQLANKAYFSAITVKKNIYESFTHKMATKASCHRDYVTVTLCVWKYFYWPPLIRGADICAPLRYSRITDIAFWRITAEMVLSVFRSIVNDVFNFFNAWRPVFCGTVFLLLDCRLFAFTVYGFAERVWEWDGNGNNPICITQWEFHVKKVANTWLPSVGFRSWSRCLAVSLQVTWVINPVVGCHYFLPGPQLPSQPLRGLFLILLLREQRHDGCEQFA